MIEYTISKKQFLDFHFAHIGNTNCYRQKILIFTLESLFFSLLLFIAVFSMFRLSFLTLIVFLLILIFFFHIKKIYFKSLKKRYNKIFSLPKYKNLFEKSYIELLDFGIQITTFSSSQIYKWAAFKSLHIINEYIFIRTYSNNSQLLIPLNFISTPEERSKFFKTIEQNTNLKWQPTYPRDVEYL